MHVHLVFVTKYRRCVLDGEAIETLQQIFSKGCTDFEAKLIQMDGENNHVHLLVNYPPKVSVSSLANSLKGVFPATCSRNRYRESSPVTGRMCHGRRLTSPRLVVEHHSASSSNTSNNRTHPTNEVDRRRWRGGWKYQTCMVPVGII